MIHPTKSPWDCKESFWLKRGLGCSPWYHRVLIEWLTKVRRVCMLSGSDSLQPHGLVARQTPLSMEFSWQEQLDWVVISSSRQSSRPRDRIWVSCTGTWILYHYVTWETLHGSREKDKISTDNKYEIWGRTRAEEIWQHSPLSSLRRVSSACENMGRHLLSEPWVPNCSIHQNHLKGRSLGFTNIYFVNFLSENGSKEEYNSFKKKSHQALKSISRIFQLAQRDGQKEMFRFEVKGSGQTVALPLTNYVTPWASPQICLSLRTLFRQVGLYLII